MSLSLAAGWRSGLVHLSLGVLAGHAYNLGVKATALSWGPYAVAFGSLPAVVSLAGSSPDSPAWWIVGVAATLGVAAHVLNTLPDFADDAGTGVVGLPHRLGARWTRVAATVLLGVGTAVVMAGGSWGPAPTPLWAWVGAAAVAVLVVMALSGTRKVPFYAAVSIALIDVALLVGLAR